MGVVVNVYSMQRVFSHEYNMLLQQLNTHYPTLIPTTHRYLLVPLSLHPTTPNNTPTTRNHTQPDLLWYSCP